MSQTVKKISVTYDAINASNTFTCGDIINGRVTVEIAKDTKIESFRIKFKGKAQVRWTEHDHHGHHHHHHHHGHAGHHHHGGHTRTYYDKEKYFKLEQFFIREVKGNDICPVLRNAAGEPYSDVVAPGTHVYPFTFQFPQQNLPPSFKGSVGFIAYTLEAKLSRSMRLSSTDKAELKYEPGPDLTIPGLMVPQHGTKDKKMKLFTSGNIAFSVTTERMGFSLGEQMKVVAEVQNNSSRDLKLKYCFYKKTSFFAQGQRKMHTEDIFKEEGETVEEKKQQTVAKIIPLSPPLTASVLNCRIIKVEYRIKVYLDVPYASDPEVKLPIVVLPATSPSGSGKAAQPPAAPSFGFEGGWNPNQPGLNTTPYVSPQPAWNSVPPTMPQPAWNSAIPPAGPQPYGPQPTWPGMLPPNAAPQVWNHAPPPGSQPAWNTMAPGSAPPGAWSGAPQNAPPGGWNNAPPSAPPPAYGALYPTVQDSSETKKSDLL